MCAEPCLCCALLTSCSRVAPRQVHHVFRVLVVAVGLQDSTSAGEGGERKRERVGSERERGMGRSSVILTKPALARSESTRQAVTGDLPSSGQPRRRRRWRHPPQQLSTAIPTNSSITQAPALMLCARAVMAVPIRAHHRMYSNKRRSVYVRSHRESKEEA